MGGRVLIAFVGLVGGTIQLAGQTPAAIRNQAADLIRGGKPVEAIAILEYAVAKAPTDARARNLLGIALSGAGRHEAAIEQFRLVLKQDPGFVAAVKNLAMDELQVGRDSDANWKTRRGPADFDVARKLSMNLSYHTPALPGANKLVRAAAGSWQMGVVTILQTGAPLSVSCTNPFQAVRNAAGQVIGNTGCDYNGDGNTNDVPNAPLSLGNLSGLDRSSYMTGIFKVSDFPIPAFGQEGNLGRGTYRGPGYANTDLSMIKNFKLPWYHSDRANLRFSAEAFNLFNRVNLADPVTTLNSTATFGQSTSARASRNIQFGMRVAF